MPRDIVRNGRRMVIYDGSNSTIFGETIQLISGEIIPFFPQPEGILYDGYGRVVDQESQVDNGESPYSDNMPGMTLDEFQVWTDQLINEVKG